MALTRSQLESGSADRRVRAFFDTIAAGEGTGSAYNVIYGGGHFFTWVRHPHVRVTAGRYTSDAAGRYQFLGSTWDGLVRQYGFPDFSPHVQDLGAVALLNQCGALRRLLNNDFAGAVNAAKGIWPSLPGGTQQTRTWAQATATYNASMGGAAPVTTPSAPSVTLPSLGLPQAVTTPNMSLIPADNLSMYNLTPYTPPAPASNLFDGTLPEIGEGGAALLLLALVFLLI